MTDCIGNIVVSQKITTETTLNYTHEYNDYGVYRKCTIANSDPDVCGLIIVVDSYGNYQMPHNESVRPIRTERDDFIKRGEELFKGIHNNLQDSMQSVYLADIYDALQSGELNAPEVKS